MKKLIIAAILASSTAACAGPMNLYANKGVDISGALGPSSNPKNVGQNRMNPRPPEGYAQQWYTTPDQCSYSRAQAPGYAPTWHLILNPHHIGQPPAHTGCPVML